MPNANARARVTRAALFGGGIVGVVFVFASGSVPCGFAHVFHAPCPGCGSTRAMLALASGDLAGLVRYNPLAPLMSLLVAALVGQALGSLLATGTFRRVGDGKLGAVVSRGVMVVASLEVLLWLARFAGFFGGPVPV
jgi:hypothetical protein